MALLIVRKGGQLKIVDIPVDRAEELLTREWIITHILDYTHQTKASSSNPMVIRPSDRNNPIRGYFDLPMHSGYIPSSSDHVGTYEEFPYSAYSVHCGGQRQVDATPYFFHV